MRARGGEDGRVGARCLGRELVLQSAHLRLGCLERLFALAQLLACTHAPAAHVKTPTVTPHPCPPQTLHQTLH